jgi:hypothetical protein
MVYFKAMTGAGLVPGFIAAIQTFGVRIDFNRSITINIKGKAERGKKGKALAADY